MAEPFPLQKLWPVAAGLISAAMLAAAHAFETFGGYAPCTLCLRQREVYWGALAVAVAGFALVRLKRLSPDVLALMLGVVFAAGAVVAAYHAGAEWKWWPGPTSCSGGGVTGISSADLTGLLNGAKVRGPACDVAAWRMFGISMAGYNAVISTVLAAVSLSVASRRPS